MYENKTPEELIALYAAAIQAETKANLGINTDKPLPILRSEAEAIGQELLHHLQEGKDSKEKLRILTEQVSTLKPGQEPV